MEMQNLQCPLAKLITYLSILSTLLLVLVLENPKKLDESDYKFISKLRASVTFHPLKNLALAAAPMEGTTWFMSSINDSYVENETEHIYFPSEESKGRILCLRGRDIGDGSKNLYALAYPESLPEGATLRGGLTFVSDTFFDHNNTWHGMFATSPFVGWSMRNRCVKPARWVLYHKGELRRNMGPWVRSLMEASFGNVEIEGFESGDGPYCFEKAVVMRHNMGKIGKERKHEVSSLIRCKSREFCGINPGGRGEPVIRFTLLLRRGARSFKNETAVAEIFAKECASVERCVFKVVHSEDLDFCEQVRVLTNTDVVASPHGAQLTNMLFMDPTGSVMEFFPRGWLEFAGVGQHAHRWTADLAGLNHEGAWWDALGEKDCPNPETDKECFRFYKQGKVGHNETYFAEWAKTVLAGARRRKLERMKSSVAGAMLEPTTCAC